MYEWSVLLALQFCGALFHSDITSAYNDINVGLKGVATQSSTLDSNGLASHAIDGDLGSNYFQRHCSSTDYNFSPWWRVDLQATFSVTSVSITNRGDNVPERINGAEVHIGESLEMKGLVNPRCGNITTLGAGETISFNCSGMAGRYVIVIIPSVYEFLTLCEVQVFANPKPVVNIALQGVVIQSSTSSDGDAAKAVDGKLRSNYDQGYCTSTAYDYTPWWRVDLNDTYLISSVAVTNKEDPNSNRLNGANIYIGSSIEKQGTVNARCATIQALGSGETRSFNCGGMAGRYVTVNIPSIYQFLTLCEVQVFVYPTPVKNVALGGVASQSSIYGSRPASISIDGSLASNVALGQCSHTSYNPTPWWRVDLMATYRVASVTVTNRLDDVPQRINGAEIRIGSLLENNGLVNPRCTTITTIAAGATASFSCSGMVGRYVTVSIPTRSEYLTLCEVQVFALPHDGKSSDSVLELRQDQRLAVKITTISPDGNLLALADKKEQVNAQIRLQIDQRLYDQSVSIMRWREDSNETWRGLIRNTTTESTTATPCTGP